MKALERLLSVFMCVLYAMNHQSLREGAEIANKNGRLAEKNKKEKKKHTQCCSIWWPASFSLVFVT